MFKYKEGMKLPVELEDGLVMRYATANDVETIAQFYGRIFAEDGVFDTNGAQWARDYMSGRHPTGGTEYVLMVEDKRADNKLVSTLCLFPQIWSYAGLPFGVGRPEAVATDPDYRRRGLVRLQMDVIHARSAAMGHLVQGITGIPWYYRQFGYEYALDLGGGRICYFSNIPQLKNGVSEPYRLRPMSAADLPFVKERYEKENKRYLISCVRDDGIWQYLLWLSEQGGFMRPSYYIIEAQDGRRVGYLKLAKDFWASALPVDEFSVIEGQPVRELFPSILRFIQTISLEIGKAHNKELVGIYFNFGRQHPLYQAIPEYLPKYRLPYGWYIRVPDLPAFLKHIQPVLEERLAESYQSGYSGEIKISEFLNGFRMVFEKGKIQIIENWKPDDSSNAAFPPLTILQLIFGRCSLSDLRVVYPDCTADDASAALLEILFPKRPSLVIPLE